MCAVRKKKERVYAWEKVGVGEGVRFVRRVLSAVRCCVRDCEWSERVVCV